MCEKPIPLQTEKNEKKMAEGQFWGVIFQGFFILSVCKSIGFSNIFQILRIFEKQRL